MISIGSSQVRRATLTIVANDRVRLLAPNRMTRRVGGESVTTELLRAGGRPSTGRITIRRHVAPRPSSPAGAVALQCLKTAVGQQAEQDARVELTLRKGIHGDENGRAHGQLQRLYDAGPRVLERQ